MTAPILVIVDIDLRACGQAVRLPLERSTTQPAEQP